MLSAQLGRRQTSLLLLDHPDYLRIGKTAFPHSSAPSGLGRLYIRLRELPGGRSNQIAPPDWYLGVVVYDEAGKDGEAFRYSEWISCELEKLPAWLEQHRTDAIAGQHKEIVRVFLVNVTRAAKFVRDRAEALGLPEGSDFSEIPI